MRKFVAIAAVAASAAATLALSPLAAHAATPPDSEIRTGCANGINGVITGPDGFSTGYTLSPGTQWDIASALGATHYVPGLYTFNINQPGALEATGPSLDEDKSFEFGTQRVEKAIVNSDDGKFSQYFNDKANSFSYFVPQSAPGVPYTFHVLYTCGVGKG